VEKIIIFDFDKTLTNYDTSFLFFLFCCKRKPLRYLYIPFFIGIKVLSKFNILSVKKEKEIGLYLFCRSDYSYFKKCCVNFAKTISLNKIYYDIFLKLNSEKENKILILSASFKDYLDQIFKNIVVIGSEVSCNKDGKITGIKSHPFGIEKKKIIKLSGIKRIHLFYTDSLSDMYISEMADNTIWIKNGKIKK